MTFDDNSFLRENTPFSKNSVYYWPSDLNDACLTLRDAPYSTSKKEFFDVRPLSTSAEEFFENQGEFWSFDIIVKSALYFFLHEKVSRRKKYRESNLSQFDWVLIIPILLNSSLNKEIIIFLEDFVSIPDDFKIIAAHFALQRFSLFNLLVLTEKSLNDFLVFLKIDEVSRKSLIKSSFEDKNFKKLTAFLSVLDSSLNQNLVLSEILQNYKYFSKSEEFFKTLEYKDKLISEVFELKLANLQNFDIFDLFESSENVKSKTSELAFFSFYDLLLDSSNTSIDLDFIEIFQLFEKFIHNSKNKSILLAEISFEKSSQFYKFLEEFYYAYQQTIIKILSKQKKLIRNLSTKKIPYDVISIGSIFAFFTLLSLLGIRPTSLNPENSRKKPLIAPQTGCFAMVSSGLQQLEKQGAQRVNSEPSLNRSAVTTATMDNRPNLVVAQQRPIPKAGLSISSKKKAVASASKTSTVNKVVLVESGEKRQKVRKKKEISIFIPDNSLVFEGMAPEICLDLLIKDIHEKVEGCHLDIRQMSASVNGVIQKVNKITISGSVSQYGRLAEVKTHVLEATRCTGGVLVLEQYEQLQMDHVSNTKLREIYKIVEARGAAVFVEKFIHHELSENRSYLAPPGLGYLPGEGGTLRLADYFANQDNEVIDGFKNNPEMQEGLASIDFSEKRLKKSYSTAHILERNVITEKMASLGSGGRGIDETTHLATSFDTYLNDQLTGQMDSFVKRLLHHPKQDIKAIGKTASILLQTGKSQREHTHAVKAFIPQGTGAYQSVLTGERKLMNAAREMVFHVEGLGATVDIDAKTTFFAEKSSNLLTPSQAYQEAKDTHGLGDFTATKLPVKEVGYNRHVPHYPKLK